MLVIVESELVQRSTLSTLGMFLDSYFPYLFRIFGFTMDVVLVCSYQMIDKLQEFALSHYTVIFISILLQDISKVLSVRSELRFSVALCWSCSFFHAILMHLVNYC